MSNPAGLRAKTYEMEFTCSNCGNSFSRDIPMGSECRGRGGSCPYCGCVDGGSFSAHRPMRLRYAEMMQPFQWGHGA